MTSIRRNLRRMKWFLGFVGAVSFAVPGAVHAEQPIILKFSHVVASDTPKGKAAERFKQLAEQRTNGRVKYSRHSECVISTARATR